MKRVVLMVAGFSAAWFAAAQVVVKSPDKRLQAEFKVDAQERLSYQVFSGQREVLATSPLGVTVDKRDLGGSVTLGKARTSKFKESYKFAGQHSKAVNHYQEAVIPLLDKSSGAELAFLECRVFDDGVAYRYRVPGSGERHIGGESSGWVLPANTLIWYQTNVRDHEDIYIEQQAANVEAGKLMGVPVTAKLAGDAPIYLMLSEANLFKYSDMCLKASGANTFVSYFHADKEGWKCEGEVLSPWRVTLVAHDLNTLANSDIIKNLCPAPPKWLAEADFYKPGRAVWHWWSIGDPLLEDQKTWYDNTKALGFEYYLIDDGWKKWRDGEKDEWTCLREQVAYGKSIGVESVIWVHSKEVKTSDERKAYMQRVKDTGVTGIKIDFMPAANSWWVQWYEDTLEDAAKIGLFVDFHGATKPTGRERTWPHDLTREAVRGHEWHISRYTRVQPPNYDTILPFCRNVQGRADYTPTVFNPDELNGYTWARELAQAVVFHSPFLCYADNPKWYLANPAVETFKAIPAVWDETRILPGSEIGKIVAVAKRSGKSWFVAVINGGEDKELQIDCSFLGRGKYDMVSYSDVAERDDAYTQEKRTVTRKEVVKLRLRSSGGYVAHFFKE